jgi:hypothetical protein
MLGHTSRRTLHTSKQDETQMHPLDARASAAALKGRTEQFVCRPLESFRSRQDFDLGRRRLRVHGKGGRIRDRGHHARQEVARSPLHSWNGVLQFYLATGDIYATQQLLGHSDVSTTASIYVQGRRQAPKEKLRKVWGSQVRTTIPIGTNYSNRRLVICREKWRRRESKPVEGPARHRSWTGLPDSHRVCIKPEGPFRARALYP